MRFPCKEDNGSSTLSIGFKGDIMYKYKVGYGSYEESEFVELEHEEEISAEEFKRIIYEATYRVLEDIKAKRTDVMTYKEGIEDLTFQDILEPVIQKLINDFDFKEIEYTESWSCFGWAAIVNNDDWRGQRGDSLDQLNKFLNLRCKSE